jgi:16S rRNA (cytosine1402-N4)-methyltransferase
VNAHQPVLLQEVLQALSPRPGGIYVDCTFGRGGHALALLAQIGPEGRVIGIDRDPEAVAAGQPLAAGDARLSVRHGRFGQLADHARAQGLAGRVDGVLFDLGVSSPQLDSPERGFSFRLDGPLDMRMDPGPGPTAAAWLAEVREADLAAVLRTYGEERHARRIARALVRARAQRPIATTRQLADLIAAANPSRERGQHPATRSFQAIRIFINRELEELGAGLAQAVDILAPGGRLAVVSFHSLEDRLTKRFLRGQARGEEHPHDLPVAPPAAAPRLRLLGRPIRPSAAEIAGNPRARSAILRLAERLP